MLVSSLRHSANLLLELVLPMFDILGRFYWVSCISTMTVIESIDRRKAYLSLNIFAQVRAQCWHFPRVLY